MQEWQPAQCHLFAGAFPSHLQWNSYGKRNKARTRFRLSTDKAEQVRDCLHPTAPRALHNAGGPRCGVQFYKVERVCTTFFCNRLTHRRFLSKHGARALRDKINKLLVDCGLPKGALSRHARDWVAKFVGSILDAERISENVGAAMESSRHDQNTGARWYAQDPSRRREVMVQLGNRKVPPPFFMLLLTPSRLQVP